MLTIPGNELMYCITDASLTVTQLICYRSFWKSGKISLFAKQVVLLSLIYGNLTNEFGITLFAQFLPTLTHLSMLFVLELVLAACSAGHFKKSSMPN